MSGRVLVIGLDGATWQVLEPFMADGDLPHLASLRARGSWGDLRSTLPPLSAPAWSTFLTGKSPARHGVFHFVDWGDAAGDGGNVGDQLVNGASIESATMWDIAAHAGRRIGAINVPMSYPPRPVNGVVVTGLLTPPDAEVFTHPPELSAELGDYQIDLDRFISAKPFAEAEDGTKSKRVVDADLSLVEEFQIMEDRRADAALKLMRAEPWDIFAVVFTATDRMGHYLWPYHRIADLDGSQRAAELHDAVRGFYRHIDARIGELIAEAGEDANVIVLSDHGMGPIYTKNTHWNQWLYDRGYVKLEAASKRTVDGWLLKLGLRRDKLRKLAKRVPGLLSSAAVTKVKRAPTATIDKAASSAYYERWFDPCGGIRVNAAGAEREQIIDRLLREVVEVVDPSTGQPIVREALRREDCLAGPYIDRAPDIVLVMDPDYGSSDRVSSYSSIVTERPHIGDPGGHHLEGIVIGAGPAIAQQADSAVGLDIADIAPTVLHLADVGVPSDIDGRVWTELLEPAGPADREVKIVDPSPRWPDDETALAAVGGSDPDDEAVRERLRALGYFA